MGKKSKIYSRKSSSGQSAIEYIVLAAAVMCVLIAFLVPGGAFHQKLNTTITQGVDQLETMVNGVQVIP